MPTWLPLRHLATFTFSHNENHLLPYLTFGSLWSHPISTINIHSPSHHLITPHLNFRGLIIGESRPCNWNLFQASYFQFIIFSLPTMPRVPFYHFEITTPTQPTFLWYSYLPYCIKILWYLSWRSNWTPPIFWNFCRSSRALRVWKVTKKSYQRI